MLCHADIHPGNLLIAEHGALFIVDWDDPIFAPKERDLMFFGAGVSGGWDAESDETLFYRGYGATDVDLAALAYYRYERIVTDIAAFGQQLLLTTEGGADREQSYRYFTSRFPAGSRDRPLRGAATNRRCEAYRRPQRLSVTGR